MSPAFHALVPAAGRGERFGGDIRKQLVEVEGRPVLAWAIGRLLEAGAASVTVALPAALLAGAEDNVLADEHVRWVAGGETRQASVAACLAACPAGEGETVLVHDGARPLVHPQDVARCVAALEGHDGAVLGRAVTDTLKLATAGEIQGTVDRAYLFRAETPQAFPRALLARALEQARADGFSGTDEASLVERLPGVQLAAVEAEHPNPKLTSRADLTLVAALLRYDRGS